MGTQRKWYSLHQQKAGAVRVRYMSQLEGVSLCPSQVLSEKGRNCHKEGLVFY